MTTKKKRINFSLATIEELEEGMPGGFFIYLADETEELLFVNDVTLDIFGCKDIEEFREYTGNSFQGMVCPEDLHVVEKTITDQVATDSRKFDHVEYRIIRKDGATRWVDDFGRLINTNDHGDVYVVFIQDITESKEIQQENIRIEVELLKERNANMVRDDFLFNVSHDIRTPMNAIMGFTDLALRTLDNPGEARRNLEKAIEAEKHMLSVVDDLLDLNRLGAGSFKLVEKECNLTHEINTVYDMMLLQAKEKGLELEKDIDLKNSHVKTDAHRFRRILGNVLENAIKFTAAGGKVSLRCRELGDSGEKQTNDFAGEKRTYVFEIIDNGIGMSSDFMKRMFMPFERESTSTESKQAGAGMGLAIAKKLMDMMDGSITVESKKGEGTKFTLTFEMEKLDKASDESGKEKSFAMASGNYRILLVEDMKINRLLAQKIIERAGIKVESAEDGSQAVNMMRQSPEGYYDLILMDIQMPVMNGYDATRAIRKLDRGDAASIPIIALSANIRDEDKKNCLDSGMNAHIAKPFEADKLVEEINHYIEQSRN